jgi:hypothetical protein
VPQAGPVGDDFRAVKEPWTVPPLWKGRKAAVIASGPSLVRDDAEMVRAAGLEAVAVKAAWHMAPWAGFLYAADRVWLDLEQGVPDFVGRKVTQDRAAAERWGLDWLPAAHQREMSLDPGRLSLGPLASNSGYQAVNLTLLLGADPILLLGFDMQVSAGTHYYGDNPAPQQNPTEDLCRQWCAGFRAAAPQLRRLGRTVLNCTRTSALDCFPRVDLREALCGSA